MYICYIVYQSISRISTKQSKMIISKSFLTTFKASIGFRGSWVVVKNGSSQKPYHYSKFNQGRLVQIRETLWSYKCKQILSSLGTELLNFSYLNFSPMFSPCQRGKNKLMLLLFIFVSSASQFFCFCIAADKKGLYFRQKQGKEDFFFFPSYLLRASAKGQFNRHLWFVCLQFISRRRIIDFRFQQKYTTTKREAFSTVCFLFLAFNCFLVMKFLLLSRVATLVFSFRSQLVVAFSK